MKPRRNLVFAFAVIIAAGGRLAGAGPQDSNMSALERAYAVDTAKDRARDAALAAQLYSEAAEAGDSFAHLRLGYLYETGDGVPQDYVSARNHYDAAAKAGLKEAHLHLALCNLEGWGAPADRKAFVRELRTAADANHAPAQRILASLYFIGFSVPEDKAEGVKWLERAAALDDADAQLSLGRSAESRNRLAVMPDANLPRTWYQLSAENDYMAGMRAMARTFLAAPATDRNWALAHRWLELAVTGGDVEAPYILAVCELLHVDSPERNEVQARAWLQQASGRGSLKATEVLQLEVGGRPLADAMRYVLNTPYDERYLQRAAGGDHAAPTRGPQVYRMVNTIYPQSLRLTGTTGRVMVDFVVDTTGRVQNPHAVESSHPLFSERAVEAVKQWRFYPGRKEGRPVNTHMRVPVIFSLDREAMAGVDGFLGWARGRAEELGPSVAADSRDLHLAHPKKQLPTPTIANGATMPADVGAIVLLVLDRDGRPLRGHALWADPEPLGAVMLALALKGEFEPRVINGEPVSSNVVLAYATGKYQSSVLKMR